MAQNTNITLSDSAWTQLTDADVTAITFQNLGPRPIYVKGTASAVAPTDATGAIKYPTEMGEANASLSDLFPGITAVRVYAWCDDAQPVMVSHA